MRYSDFTNLYSLQKTLRFELIPQGKTEENIRELVDQDGTSLIERDEKRAEKYKHAKKMIDIFHRYHIEEALKLVDFKALDCFGRLETIQENLFTQTDDIDKKKKAIEEAQAELRKAIVSVLTGSINKKILDKYSKNNQKILERINDRFKLLTSKDLFDSSINSEFRSIVEAANYSEATFDDIIPFFKGFATYFTGFNENRKNIYSGEAQITAISNRIINENLPKFLDNIQSFNKVKNILPKSDFTNIKKSHKLKKGVESFFTLENFQNVLNQTGIDEYNRLIGGFFIEDSKEKIQGLNEKINLFNQKNPDSKLPRLTPLFKQILSETTSTSFRPEPFENDAELLIAINDFWNNHIQKAKNEADLTTFNVLQTFIKAINQLKSMKIADLQGIFIDGKKLTSLSHQVFSDWSFLSNALSANYRNNNNNETDAQQEKAITALLKKDYYSLAELDSALNFYFDQIKQSEKKEFKYHSLLEFFSKGVFIDLESKNSINEVNLVNEITNSYNKLKPILKDQKTLTSNTLHQDKSKVAIIKEFLDQLKNLERYLRYFETTASNADKKSDFYSLWDACLEAIFPLRKLYDKVRNRLTRKPFSQDKLKLNFDQTTLLNGWDISKETANLSIILEKDGLYYLAVMNKTNNQLFTVVPKPKTNNYYKKLNYKLLPGPNKMLPKVFFSKKGIDNYKPSKNILDLYEKGSFKQGDNFKKADLHHLIDFYKDAINKNEDWQIFNFKFKTTKDYENIAEFYYDVEKQGYQIWFTNIDIALIDEWVNDGKLFLFQLYNKDFSPFSKGQPNLHTIYWRNLFSKDNFKSYTLKLNGEAEIFFRPASINYTDEERKKGHHTQELKGKFSYPILKDRRYSLDKFHFHVPITLNFNPKGKTDNLNKLAHYYIESNPKIKAIGVDRGERHLLYLSLINHDGKILEQYSLNTLHNEKANKDIDFHEKLDTKEKERQQARQSWNIIENIKELKEGYLSLIVHKIVQLMIKHEAILIMEDLNFGFKRGRFKVEKQVYQKFEKMLIDKLNYLTFKDIEPTAIGGSLNAFQLSSKFTSFQKLGKQSGMIFYVPAAYTSTIDPVTGFYNFLRPKQNTIALNQAYFSKFDSIRFNAKSEYFEFHTTYGNFVNTSKKSKNKIESQLSKKQWIICSHNAERYQFQRSKNGSISFKPYDCNQELKNLFTSVNIEYQDGQELKESIIAQSNASFFKALIENLRILLALRYNNGKKGADEKDYILSPVANANGVFFNSLNQTKGLPIDADANGAYHIAKKGLLLAQKIRDFDNSKKGYPDLKISHEEWLASLWL